MALDPNTRRRWIGAVLVLAALGMVVCGETVLRDRLGPLQTLMYWLGCLVLTTLAILVAILDVRALRQRTRREERALFDSTLRKIQSDLETRPQARPRSGNGVD
jgi:hypothetical protein